MVNSTPPSDNPTNLGLIRNIAIALVAIILAIALFLGLQTPSNSNSLESQAEQSVPLDVALSNGKPTLLEFYANWCTSCQAMAGDLEKIKNDYGASVNFAMLNVDNSKWLPEILKYRVDGIPHFVYLNKQGDAIAQTIGEQPLAVLQADLEALIAAVPLPYANATGKTSDFQRQLNPNSPTQTDPRRHSSQSQ
ncbi:MAG: thioredoxin family protein [Jaaginema sp. PMC 1079.18]|nr:thioredoxin family protein [Jaaginema sp. PMC 1080.18]MEC4852435.1 thioredoxin family protein [Jaaginema sp. PMC 1079.18]MEC4865575.1 thioredoxin family protein [Jaaginema sp. PMC 1078.18]